MEHKHTPAPCMTTTVLTDDAILACIIHEQMSQQDGFITDMVAAIDGCDDAKRRVQIAFDAAVVLLAHKTARRLADGG